MKKGPNQRLDKLLQCLLDDAIKFFERKANAKKNGHVPNRQYFEKVTALEIKADALVRGGHVHVLDARVGSGRVWLRSVEMVMICKHCTWWCKYMCIDDKHGDA